MATRFEEIPGDHAPQKNRAIRARAVAEAKK